ncbi:MAG: hypothetical protein AAFV43_11030 [Planctomycetota bacterium]
MLCESVLVQLGVDRSVQAAHLRFIARLWMGVFELNSEKPAIDFLQAAVDELHEDGQRYGSSSHLPVDAGEGASLDKLIRLAASAEFEDLIDSINRAIDTQKERKGALSVVLLLRACWCNSMGDDLGAQDAVSEARATLWEAIDGVQGSEFDSLGKNALVLEAQKQGVEKSRWIPDDSELRGGAQQLLRALEQDSPARIAQIARESFTPDQNLALSDAFAWAVENERLKQLLGVDCEGLGPQDAVEELNRRLEQLVQERAFADSSAAIKDKVVDCLRAAANRYGAVLVKAGETDPNQHVYLSNDDANDGTRRFRLIRAADKKKNTSVACPAVHLLIP